MYDEETEEFNEMVFTGVNLQITCIPGHYWHCFKALGVEPVYFVTRLYNYADPDEERRPWNDPTVVPRWVNGRRDDPRVGKPWD